MPNNEEICTAPSGKVRLVHVDPRDHWRTFRGDFDSMEKLCSSLTGVLHAEVLTLKAFDDKGKELGCLSAA